MPCRTNVLEAAGRGPDRDVWLGVHADLRQMPRIRAVIEALDGELERQRPRMDPA